MHSFFRWHRTDDATSKHSEDQPPINPNLHKAPDKAVVKSFDQNAYQCEEPNQVQTSDNINSNSKTRMCRSSIKHVLLDDTIQPSSKRNVHTKNPTHYIMN